MAYLDDTGLAYFWGKIKAWANSVFALISHTHSSSDVTQMTGYSMPASTGAISSNDTLNQAVGKLEKAMDAADISNVVHRTGDETVGGEKTFTGPFSRDTNVSGMIVRHQNLTRGTVPSANAYFAIPFCDASGAEYAAGGVHGRFGLLEGVVASNGVVSTRLAAYQNVAGSTVAHGISVSVDSSGNGFATAPSTSPDRALDTDILTRDWIPKDTRIVHTSGAEVIEGAKTFRTNPIVKSTNLSRDSTDTDITNLVFKFEDINAKRFFTLVCRRFDSDFKNRTRLISFNKNDDYGEIICDFTDAGNYTVSVTTSVSGASATLVSNYMRANTFISATADSLSRNTTSSMAILRGGDGSAYSGATLGLYGATRSVHPGYFYLSAITSSSASKSLEGRPDGTLLWNGQTVQTSSDERLKTPLSAVPDDVLDAWLDVEWGQFQFLDAIAEKGSAARFHAGLIAQSVDRTFAGAGLDACRYGILCHEFRDASDMEEEEIVQEAFTDLDGMFHPAVKRTRVFHEDAVDLWTVRYAEALCMEAACMRRENARLKKRVADLEERLAALELKVS